MANSPTLAPAAIIPAALTPKQAATYLAMARSTLDELAHAGSVPPPVRIGKKVLYCRAELDAWLAHGGPNIRDWKPIWLKLRDQH